MAERTRPVEALVSALRFRDPRPERLGSLSAAEWTWLLRYSDSAHLTLILGCLCREHLPQKVRKRIARNLADNTERVERIQRTYGEVSEALREAGAEHLVLKGFSQWPGFAHDLRLRPQSDIDIYCRGRSSLFRARDALLDLGYEFERAPERNDCQLPALIRHNGWQWRGNAFDPEMPLEVELHYLFWNSSYAWLGSQDFEPFWDRRIERQIGMNRFSALDPVDSFAYAGLHALRHLLLYGALLPAHIYELAYFLHQNADNEPLWKTWLSRHDPELRSLAAVPSLMAAQWFACDLPAAVEAEIAMLPPFAPRWLRKTAPLPPSDLFRVNKDALWLHLSLVEKRRDRLFVLVRRLFPLWIPRLNSRWVQEKDGDRNRGRRRPLQKYFTYMAWFAARAIRHLRMLPPTLWRGLRLWAG